MAVEITLTLPEVLVEQAKRFGKATKRDAEAVLADTLGMMWLTLGELPDTSFLPSVSGLPDDELITLADSKMDAVQNRRLGLLQSKGKEHRLSHAECYELMALLHIYQLGQLRKSEGLAEAVRRGLRSPLAS